MTPITKKAIKQHILNYHSDSCWKYDFKTLKIIYDTGEDLGIKIKRKYIFPELGFAYYSTKSKWEDCEIEIPYLQYIKKKENQLF